MPDVVIAAPAIETGFSIPQTSGSRASPASLRATRSRSTRPARTRRRSRSVVGTSARRAPASPSRRRSRSRTLRRDRGEERRRRHAESRLRLARQRPAVHDRRAARPGSTDSATLYLGCNLLARSTNRGANWTTIAPVDALTGPAPADDRPTTTRCTRASSRRSRRSRRRSPTRTRSTWAPTTGGSGGRPTSAGGGRSSRTRSRPTRPAG